MKPSADLAEGFWLYQDVLAVEDGYSFRNALRPCRSCDGRLLGRDRAAFRLAVFANGRMAPDRVGGSGYRDGISIFVRAAVGGHVDRLWSPLRMGKVRHFYPGIVPRSCSMDRGAGAVRGEGRCAPRFEPGDGPHRPDRGSGDRWTGPSCEPGRAGRGASRRPRLRVVRLDGASGHFRPAAAADAPCAEGDFRGMPSGIGVRRRRRSGSIPVSVGDPRAMAPIRVRPDRVPASAGRSTSFSGNAVRRCRVRP